MFQQHYYPDHHSATDSSHMMHPFYTLGSPYPLYPTFTYSLYDRAHPPNAHGAFHAPPPQTQTQPQPPHRRSSVESNFNPNPNRTPNPNPTHDSRPAYGSRPSTFQSRAMKSSYQQPHQKSYPLYYNHHDYDEQQYEHMHPQEPYDRDHDHQSYILSHHPHPSRMLPTPTPLQRTFTHGHRHQHMYERNPRWRAPDRYPTRNTTYHEDGHGMGLLPFQQECDESDMYPHHIDTHIPSYQREWNDAHDEFENDEDYESQSSHHQVPIRVIPVTFTNVSRNNLPLRRRFLIAHKPTRPMESSDSEWDDTSSSTSYQYDPNELSSMLQANPDAIRPLLLQLLPLYEPYLRQALKHDEEKDQDKKKDSMQDKENKPATTAKSNTNANSNINTKANKAGTKTTNTNTTSTSKPQSTTTSTGPTKATKGLFSKFTEPEIKKMTPPTTRMRIIHPVQEKESHLEQSQVYKVPSPSPEELAEQLPPPARPRQLYSFTAHHEEDGKEKKETVKEKDKAKPQDKNKDEIPSTNTKTGSQRNIDIKESSTSRDIPIRGTATSTAASTAPTSAPAPAPAPAPSSSTSTTRDTPIRERHEPKRSDVSNGTSSTTLRNINIEEKKREQPKKDELKVESDQVPTSTPPPTAVAPTPEPLTSTPSSTLIHPNPHIRRHSPHVEIEDVPATSAHHAASPVHRHTLSHDSLNPTITPTSVPLSATTPTSTLVAPSTSTKEDDETVDPMKEEKEKPTTQEQTHDINTNKPTEEAQKDTTETNIETDHTTHLDTSSGTTTTGNPEVSNQHDVQVTGDSTTVYDSPINSPTSSTYSSILQSCTGSPVVSAPTSPEQQHHRIDSQDQDWHFTSPLMKTNTLKRNEKVVDMNMITQDKDYIVTITLPEHITKHDIRLDTDVSGITVESIDDPPMFPSRSLSLPSDADINNLSAKSELIDDFHTIIVKIPKRITNKRPIRIE